MEIKISIDGLIEIISKGGKVKTGINIFNKKGVQLLNKDLLVSRIKTLQMIQKEGLNFLPLDPGKGGIWNAEGKRISIDKRSMRGKNDHQPAPKSTGMDASSPYSSSEEIEQRLQKIKKIKTDALIKYNKAKESVKKTMNDIKNQGGKFDYNEVENNVSELVDFLTLFDNPFAYLAKEIISYDDYLYSHSVNVCAIGTAVLNRFNKKFSSMTNKQLGHIDKEADKAFADDGGKAHTYMEYLKKNAKDICIGFFLHDIGKVLVPDKILNKKGRLTSMEFDIVRTHSYKLGPEILNKNNLQAPFIKNIVKYHHANLYEGENRCYPDDKSPVDIPLYVKICKLADIYDAMTSKRCYKEAFNQINVVNDIFRQYAKKDKTLQYILHSFVQTVGIYPTGSLVYLKNGQMAYVLESEGPLVLPFTDTSEKPLLKNADPINLKDPNIDDHLKIDNKKNIKKPLEVFDLLPSYLKS